MLLSREYTVRYVTIEFQGGNDESKDEGEEIAGQTTLFDEYGFIDKAEIIMNKGVQDYEFDTKQLDRLQSTKWVMLWA
jgi:hypothetical protein